jgi:DNA-directed RNA polymerase III subunit RPC6
MRTRSNLPQPHIAKVLRTLEQRNLVKIVKNVNNPSRKVYMLAELEPSRDLTGGAW